MNHLNLDDWQDIDNHMKGDPDDFILPKDDDDGQIGRQQDTDFNAEVKRIQEILKRARQNPLFQKQAN